MREQGIILAIFLSFLILSLIIQLSAYFLIMKFQKEKIEEVENVPSFTGDKNIDEILFWDTNVFKNIKKRGKLNLSEIKLVNLVHIHKEDSTFKISCKFGPLYRDTPFDNFYPESLISLGKIKSCDEETAKIIDKIARTPKRDCRLPLETPLPPYLNDYYIVTLAWGVKEVTPEWVQLAREIDPCYQHWEKLTGKNAPHFLIVAIIDKDGGVVY
jgi:hypothetical protein